MNNFTQLPEKMGLRKEFIYGIVSFMGGLLISALFTVITCMGLNMYYKLPLLTFEHHRVGAGYINILLFFTAFCFPLVTFSLFKLLKGQIKKEELSLNKIVKKIFFAIIALSTSIFIWGSITTTVMFIFKGDGTSWALGIMLFGVFFLGAFAIIPTLTIMLYSKFIKHDTT